MEKGDKWDGMYSRRIEWMREHEWYHYAVASFENFGMRYLDIKPVRTLSRLKVEMDRGCLRAWLLPLPGSVRDCFPTLSGWDEWGWSEVVWCCCGFHSCCCWWSWSCLAITESTVVLISRSAFSSCCWIVDSQRRLICSIMLSYRVSRAASLGLMVSSTMDWSIVVEQLWEQ